MVVEFRDVTKLYDGGSVGAAYWAYNHVLGQPRGFVMRDAATGPAD